MSGKRPKQPKLDMFLIKNKSAEADEPPQVTHSTSSTVIDTPTTSKSTSMNINSNVETESAPFFYCSLEEKNSTFSIDFSAC